jgi:hypothetical protein
MRTIRIPEDIAFCVLSGNGPSGPVVIETWAPGEEPPAYEGSDGKPVDLSTAKPIVYSFVRDFVSRIILADPSWGRDLESAMMAHEIRGLFRRRRGGTALEAVRPGDTVDMVESHYRAFVAVMQAPSGGYNAAIVGRWGAWIRAISDASISDAEGSSVREAETNARGRKAPAPKA